MGLKSRSDRYGAVAILIHWVSAIVVLAMLATGLAAANGTEDGGQWLLLRAHVVMGIAIGLLTLLRIVWWLAFDRRPADVAMGRRQVLAAHIVHYGLYAVLLVMVSSGIATLILTGAGQQIFTGTPAPLPDFSLAPPMTVHGLLSRLLIVLLIGHVGAALWHQFVLRDRLLARMGIGG